MNKYEKLFSLAIVVFLVMMLIGVCNRRPQSTQTEDPRIELMQKKIDSLTYLVNHAEVRVDTFYAQKAEVKKKAKAKVAEIALLNPEQKDSLFKLIYPTIDSANATYYWCIESRQQEALSDSIIVQKDTIIFALKEQKVLSDSTAGIYKSERDKARKKAEDDAYKLYLWKNVGIALIATDVFVVLSFLALR